MAKVKTTVSGPAQDPSVVWVLVPKAIPVDDVCAGVTVMKEIQSRASSQKPKKS